ncbi:MAG TPA: hypothetical protein VH419_01490 [Nocardioidaceae bacterium]
MALARVVTFEGGTAEGLRAAVEEVNGQMRDRGGPPEGVKSIGMTFLVDPDGGRAMFVGIFENEADLNDSTATLEAMSPPEGMGQRASVDVYEVGADVRM